MKYIYVIKPRKNQTKIKIWFFFKLFINNVCHASQVRTVSFTHCYKLPTYWTLSHGESTVRTTTKMSFSVQILHILRYISCMLSSINNRVSVRERSEKDLTLLYRLIFYQFIHFTCLNLMICKVSNALLIRVLLVTLFLF